jgi:hypothetical protein
MARGSCFSSTLPAQHLGLKAVYLAELEIAEADQIAIAVLHRVINRHSGISFEVVFAHETLGSIYERIGRFEDAEREYRWVVNSSPSFDCHSRPD